nr:MAG TPA: hypothetical protein [Caudoviricetes sp.]
MTNRRKKRIGRPPVLVVSVFLLAIERHRSDLKH